MNFFKNLTLKAKWMIYISFAIVLAVGITVVFSQWNVRNILEEENHQTSSDNAKNAVNQVSLGLLNYESAILQFSQVVEAILTNEEKDYTQIDKITKTLQEQNSDYLAVYFMDFKTGKLHVTPEITYDWDVRDSQTFAKLNSNPNLQWMDIYLDTGVNQLMTSVIAPIFNNGKLVGAVGFDIDFSTIGSIRESIEEGTSSQLMIVDPNGLIVSSFIEDGDGKNINADNSGKIEGVSDLLNPRELATEFSWLLNDSNTNNQIEQFNWAGVDYSGEIQTIEKNNWKIVSVIDKDNFAEKLKEFTINGWISLIIGLIIGCLFAYFMSIKLIQIFSNLKKVFERTASGDFISRFETNSNDEIADLANHYNQMLDGVHRLVLQVNENTNAIRNSSNSLAIIAQENEQALYNVSTSIEEIAMSSSKQAEKMQDGSNALHVLAEGIETIELQSKQVADDAAEALIEANTTIHKVDQLEETYTNLERAFQEVTVVASNLDDKTKSISQVTKLIAQITEQTNLLALNASIEAARAGEHGKGFAVVADEVRKLAENSKAATTNIQEIIKSILEDTEQLVQVMQQTNEISDNQKVAVDTVNNAIKQLSDTLENMKESITRTMEDVSTMQQQKNVVLSSMLVVHEMTTEVTAETQEIASSIEEQTSATTEVTSHATHLNEQVEKLSDSVSKFKL
ncbi:methyl-accepting chemotaxis protein [Solibacillus sp. FSL W8-0474]|uniref:methyl-accepting chemotaxis protein n=1 Tax=Solibacillus sp. FSL W8-0474 TaxID=2975336 RepID=UPI0030FAFF6C